jgi:hypothetical protein
MILHHIGPVSRCTRCRTLPSRRPQASGCQRSSILKNLAATSHGPLSTRCRRPWRRPEFNSLQRTGEGRASGYKHKTNWNLCEAYPRKPTGRVIGGLMPFLLRRSRSAYEPPSTPGCPRQPPRCQTPPSPTSISRRAPSQHLKERPRLATGHSDVGVKGERYRNQGSGKYATWNPHRPPPDRLNFRSLRAASIALANHHPPFASAARPACRSIARRRRSRAAAFSPRLLPQTMRGLILRKLS